ncbi:hypothetical protein B0H17DRAFT_1153271 [Mycena rosella]|uniref:Uncharacterized protein n=1 Tax=Mycena rosella TaxID=1033263 RepID=A0AAD7FAV3_MYCRO|nr:hypothetical protein B0H17DRAFT_1153271 [Mycena rosella]
MNRGGMSHIIEGGFPTCGDIPLQRFRGMSQMVSWDVQMVSWDVPNDFVGRPRWFRGTSHMCLWDVPSIEVGHPTFAHGMSHMSHGAQCHLIRNVEAYSSGTEAVGAHPSNVQGGGTFMQAHLIRNAEAYLSGTEAVGAHPSNVQGGGTFMQAHLIRNAEAYLSGTEAISAHPSNVQGGGTFMQAHLIRNAEAYLSGTEAVGAHPSNVQGGGLAEAYSSGTEAIGAHPYNTQGRGACKPHTGKVVAAGAEPSDTQGRSACSRGMSHTCQKAKILPACGTWDIPRPQLGSPHPSSGTSPERGRDLKNPSLGLVPPAAPEQTRKQLEYEAERAKNKAALKEAGEGLRLAFIDFMGSMGPPGSPAMSAPAVARLRPKPKAKPRLVGAQGDLEMVDIEQEHEQDQVTSTTSPPTSTRGPIACPDNNNPQRNEHHQHVIRDNLNVRDSSPNAGHPQRGLCRAYDATVNGAAPNCSSPDAGHPQQIRGDAHDPPSMALPATPVPSTSAATPMAPPATPAAPMLVIPSTSTGAIVRLSAKRNVSGAVDVDALPRVCCLVVSKQDLGCHFDALIAAWTRIEYASRFEHGPTNLSSIGCPAQLGAWIAGGRGRRGSMPVISDITLFAEKWGSWWASLQPGWREKGRDRKWPIGGEYGGGGKEWGPLYQWGVNGTLTLLAALYFWGCAVKDGVRGSEAGMGEWEDAVADVTWMLEGMATYYKKFNRRF